METEHVGTLLHLPCELVGTLGERSGRTGGWRGLGTVGRNAAKRPSGMCYMRGDGSKPMWENCCFFKAAA